MIATTTPSAPYFVREIILQMIQVFDDGTKQAYRMIWSILTSFLVEHWFIVMLVLVFILIIAFVRYLMTGRWGTLGSVLYNYIYFGILFLITLVFGPDVFANDWFKLVLFILYVITFIWVGKILRKMGAGRY